MLWVGLTGFGCCGVSICGGCWWVCLVLRGVVVSFWACSGLIWLLSWVLVLCVGLV